MSSPTRPSWIKEPPPLEDEVIKGPWNYHVLQMANRHHKPARLAYSSAPTGEDQRLKYMLYFLDVREQRVLELGPLEGHHSVILEKMGVRELIAIESRDGNIARCRRIKEKYHLTKTTYVQQNIEELYEGRESPQFDLGFDSVFCSGLLYHVPNPAKALVWCGQMAPSLFLATHYVETASPQSYPATMFRLATLTNNNRQYEGYGFYEGGVGDPGSGMSRVSFWPTERMLLDMLAHAGYRETFVLGKDLQNGFPHITILANH